MQQCSKSVILFKVTAPFIYLPVAITSRETSDDESDSEAGSRRTWLSITNCHDCELNPHSSPLPRTFLPESLQVKRTTPMIVRFLPSIIKATYDNYHFGFLCFDGETPSGRNDILCAFWEHCCILRHPVAGVVRPRHRCFLVQLLYCLLDVNRPYLEPAPLSSFISEP